VHARQQVESCDGQAVSTVVRIRSARDHLLLSLSIRELAGAMPSLKGIASVLFAKPSPVSIDGEHVEW
jgi:hypothetical protein